ncbi:DsbE family thiol:disulfide interchange protein [Paracoccus jiaweipingae]|uniref:DsbE family thiol:disulfide interchange protein n=1 Tax=unclassified Paracoccus (in: a-proteobacteria) TaxID=2688777 RepID=UPI0037B39EF0
MAKLPLAAILPPLIFAGLAAVFLWGMARENPSQIPSAMIGRDAPALPAQTLPGKAALTDADLRAGQVTVVNFWASWCPPCRAEHPVLKQMAADGIRLAGVNFKDKQLQASAYLKGEGDPFFALGFDPNGRSALDWGVTAPPETFIVDGQGKVLYRFVGPLIGSDYEKGFLPELNKALGR